MASLFPDLSNGPKRGSCEPQEPKDPSVLKIVCMESEFTTVRNALRLEDSFAWRIVLPEVILKSPPKRSFETGILDRVHTGIFKYILKFLNNP